MLRVESHRQPGPWHNTTSHVNISLAIRAMCLMPGMSRCNQIHRHDFKLRI